MVIVDHAHADKALACEVRIVKCAESLVVVALVFGEYDEAAFVIVVESGAVVVFVGTAGPTYGLRREEIVLDHARHALIVEVGEQHTSGRIGNGGEGAVLNYVDDTTDVGTCGATRAASREEGGGFRSFVVAQHTHCVAVELVNAARRTDRYEHVLFTQRLGDGECLGIALEVLTGVVFREDIAFRLATVKRNVGQLRAVARSGHCIEPAAVGILHVEAELLVVSGVFVADFQAANERTVVFAHVGQVFLVGNDFSVHFPLIRQGLSGVFLRDGRSCNAQSVPVVHVVDVFHRLGGGDEGERFVALLRIVGNARRQTRYQGDAQGKRVKNRKMFHDFAAITY